jgi:hypothetical protein
LVVVREYMLAPPAHNVHYTGVDISKELIAEAKTHENAKHVYYVADATKGTHSRRIV